MLFAYIAKLLWLKLFLVYFFVFKGMVMYGGPESSTPSRPPNLSKHTNIPNVDVVRVNSRSWTHKHRGLFPHFLVFALDFSALEG